MTATPIPLRKSVDEVKCAACGQLIANPQIQAMWDKLPSSRAHFTDDELVVTKGVPCPYCHSSLQYFSDETPLLAEVKVLTRLLKAAAKGMGYSIRFNLSKVNK